MTFSSILALRCHIRALKVRKGGNEATGSLTARLLLWHRLRHCNTAKIHLGFLREFREVTARRNPFISRTWAHIIGDMRQDRIIVLSLHGRQVSRTYTALFLR